MTRLERHLRKSPNEKSLGPTIGGAPRNLNPFTAIDADKDLVVLEDIATVNFGKGVPDPTPGGVVETPSVAERRSRFDATNDEFAVAAMTGPKRTISDSNPADMKNPDGHFPRENGPMWKDVNYVALNVAPRSRRGATPASVNTYLHAEWTEPYWDAVRDETGIWNSPPPPEMEVERAIYDAMKRETIEVGGYGAPFPRYPKESDYYEYDAGVPGYVATALRPSRKFPFAETGAEASWTDGHPLYHATPTGLLPRVIADGLVGIPDRPLWFGASPSVWNEQWPDRRDAIRKAPAKGMSFLRVSPTDEINGRLSRLANLKRSNPDTPAGMLAMDSEGKKIDVRDSDSKRAATLFGEAILFDDVKIPAENIEVLNQNGQWIPLYRADFSDVVFDPSGGVDVGMANDKNRGIRRVLSKLTNGKFGGEPEAETPSEQPLVQAPEDPRIALEFPVPQPRVKYSDSYGGDDLIKGEQIAQRTEHERLAASGSWSRIHSDHYDWWAYPIDRGSSAYGETFNVAGEPLERLKTDQEFLSSLAKEIEIQALALGWSLYDGDFIPQLDWEKGQDWRKAYPTRLWKMTRSAQIFGLEREFESLLSLQGSLEAAGIRFNHSDYWNNPGTIDDVPSLGKSWTEREEERRQRFPASDATNWTSPYGPTYPSTDGGADRLPKPSSEEDNVWDAYDNYAETPVFSVVSDAEELADILSEPDDVIEFGYPYERIDKETRQLIADDIFFAISLLMDGEFPDEEEVDRRESAQQMRKYADEQDGLYPDDGDILYALADALEDPVSLYENAVYESTDSPDGEAGMGRRFRGLDEEPDYSDMSLSDTEIQNFIESEFDMGTDDRIFGREVSRLVFEDSTFYPQNTKPVRQISIPTLEEIPEDLKQSYVKLWAAGASFARINRQLEISAEYGAAIQTALLKSGEILPRIKRTSGESLRLSPEDEEVFVEWFREGADTGSLTSVFGLTVGQYSEIVEDLRNRGLIPKRYQKHFFTDNDRDAFATIVGEERTKGRGIWPRSVLRAQRELGWSKERAISMLLWYKGQIKFGQISGIRTNLSDFDMMRLAAQYNAGVPLEQIAQEFNVLESSIYALVDKARKRGIYVKRRNSTDVDATSGLRRSPGLFRAWSVAVENGTTSGGYEEFVEGIQKRAVALYRDGKTYAEIAKDLGIKGHDAKYLVDRAVTSGDTPPRRRGRPSKVATALGITVDELVERLAARYNEGKTRAEIAAEFGTTMSSLGYFLGVASKRGLLKLGRKRKNLRTERNIAGRSARKTRPTDGSDGEAGMSGPSTTSREPERGDLIRFGRSSNNPYVEEPGSLGRVVGVARDGTISADFGNGPIKLTPGEDDFLVIPRQVDTLYELTDDDGNVMYVPVEDVTYPRISRAFEEATEAGYRQTGIIRGNTRRFFDEATGTYRTSLMDPGAPNAENIAPETTAPVPFQPTNLPDGEAGMSGPNSVNLPDEIDEELKDHVYEDPVFGLSIKHPLFFWIAPITPEITELINTSFAQKRAAAEEALKQKNWGRYIYLHERPFRIDAFEDVMDEMTDQEYWSRLSDIWVDSENIGAQPDRWRNLLLSDRGSRQSFMTDDELAEFAALQPRFTVYRGYSENDQEEFGMSWSTDAGVAEWFARRFAREDEKIFMEEMEVSKDDVFAYLTRRGEEEIILYMRTVAGGAASRRELPLRPKTRIPTRSRQSTAPDGEAGMSSELLKRATDDEAQLDLLYSIPGVRASVVLRNTDGVPTAPGKNAIAKPYFLAPHVDVNKINPDDPVIKLLSPALRGAGLGTYPVRGHSVPKVQGPVVKDFADRLIGPSALADAVLGTFPTADEIVTIYAINALIRARAEYLSDSVLNADQVNTAILNGVQIGRNDDGSDSGGVLWTPSQNGIYGGGFSITDVGAGPEARYTGTLDPFAYFTGRSDFLKSVVAALPEAVKSKLDPFLTRDGNISSWEDTSFFESIIIREDDKLSRAFAPMVRAQARTAVDHARRHEELTKKWAQTAYDMMKEAGLTDAEVAFVVNEHWANAAAFNLENVRPGSVMGSAARLGVKAFSSRFSPITQSVAGYTFGEEEDYGLHEFFHHYLGQGFTRHGEYVAFRGPANMIDSYRGHLQWAWNVHGQLGMFVSKVMSEAFGGGLRPDGEPRALFDAIGRAIYDRLKEMLASPEDRRRIMDQIFPEFLDTTTEDEARIKDLIRNQFLIRQTIDLPFRDRMPALRLMTAHDFLVPKEYWPYGGTSRIIEGNER